jgi:MoaA/NifB/PqqE/SkfB family radical SAM enzyme
MHIVNQNLQNCKFLAIFVEMSSPSIIKDSVQWINSSSLKKVLNFLSLKSSFFLSKITRRAIHWGMPMSVSIEPTTSCNLRCPECPSGLRAFTRATGMLTKEGFQAILNPLKKQLWAINFYFQGEPFLNKELLSMVRLAADEGIYTATSTNAHYFTTEVAEATVKSGLHRLIISLDGTSQDTYEQYRIGGNLKKVIEGTKHVIEAKNRLKSSTPHIIFQFLVVRPNEHQTDDALKLANELGVDEVRFKTAQVYDYENGNDLIPHDERYSRYRQKSNGKWELKNKMADHCWRMWQGCVFTWDGNVVPCCFDKDAHHPMGKAIGQDFISIWKGASYQSFRLAVLSGRSEIEICKNCSEGTKVWA